MKNLEIGQDCYFIAMGKVYKSVITKVIIEEGSTTYKVKNSKWSFKYKDSSSNGTTLYKSIKELTSYLSSNIEEL